LDQGSRPAHAEDALNFDELLSRLDSPLYLGYDQVSDAALVIDYQEAAAAIRKLQADVVQLTHALKSLPERDATLKARLAEASLAGMRREAQDAAKARDTALDQVVALQKALEATRALLRGPCCHRHTSADDACNEAGLALAALEELHQESRKNLQSDDPKYSIRSSEFDAITDRSERAMTYLRAFLASTVVRKYFPSTFLQEVTEFVGEL